MNRAARVMAIAKGGQILVSRATEELVADHLPRPSPAGSGRGSGAEGLGAAGAGVPGGRARPSERLLAAGGDVRAGEPPPARDDPVRPGRRDGSARAVPRPQPTGHGGRLRWCRQDPSRHRGRASNSPELSTRCLVLRSELDQRRRGRAQRGGTRHRGRRGARTDRSSESIIGRLSGGAALVLLDNCEHVLQRRRRPSSRR